MAAKTTAEYQALLDEVDDAIEAVLTRGQSVSFDGVTYTAANIDGLLKLQSYYEHKIDLADKGDRRVAEF